MRSHVRRERAAKNCVVDALHIPTTQCNDREKNRNDIASSTYNINCILHITKPICRPIPNVEVSPPLRRPPPRPDKIGTIGRRETPVSKQGHAPSLVELMLYKLPWESSHKDERDRCSANVYGHTIWKTQGLIRAPKIKPDTVGFVAELMATSRSVLLCLTMCQ